MIGFTRLDKLRIRRVGLIDQFAAQKAADRTSAKLTDLRWAIDRVDEQIRQYAGNPGDVEARPDTYKIRKTVNGKEI